MASVKWIKIVTDIFDDEKILMIESMPSSDSIIVIWFKLLTLAGKQNNDGVFLMSNRIPYTDEMLASIFRRDLNTIRLALRTFEQFGMIEIIDNVITIPNWGKHQTLDAYEKKKARDRERIARKRAAQKALIAASPDTSLNMSPDISPDASPDVAFSEEEREEEKEREGDKEKERDKRGSRGNETPSADAPGSPAPSPPVRHKYGQYKNVLLSDQDMDKLKAEFPEDYENRIERLSEYMASTGKKYKNHLATIRNWASRDRKEGGKQNAKRGGGVGGTHGAIEESGAYGKFL